MGFVHVGQRTSLLALSDLNTLSRRSLIELACWFTSWGGFASVTAAWFVDLQGGSGQGAGPTVTSVVPGSTGRLRVCLSECQGRAGRSDGNGQRQDG
jgi:hypothetical protein